jgi:hypothetical protein
MFRVEWMVVHGSQGQVSVVDIPEFYKAKPRTKKLALGQ